MSALERVVDADVLRFNFILFFNDVVPPALSTVFVRSPMYNRCIPKPAGGLSFRLNSVRDLGFPAPVDFDVNFTGQVEEPHTPSDPNQAIVRWDVNEVVNQDFVVNGKKLRVDSLNGTLRAVVAPWSTVHGTNCAGESRTFTAMLLSVGGVNEPGGSLPNTMLLRTELQGAVYDIPLNNMTLAAFAGAPDPARLGFRNPLLTTWPLLLAEMLVERRGPGGDFGPLENTALVTSLDAHLAALHIAALAGRLRDRGVAREIGQLAVKVASTPITGLGDLVRPG